MTIEQRTIAAADAGKAAFHRGALRVPALDAAIKPLLVGNECLPVLTAWLKAWDTANLAAPIHSMTCEDCGGVEGVDDTFCPYDQEISGIDSPVRLCGPCCQQRANDI